MTAEKPLLACVGGGGGLDCLLIQAFVERNHANNLSTQYTLYHLRLRLNMWPLFAISLIP